jgi:hypothetical protein
MWVPHMGYLWGYYYGDNVIGVGTVYRWVSYGSYGALATPISVHFASVYGYRMGLKTYPYRGLFYPYSPIAPQKPPPMESLGTQRA